MKKHFTFFRHIPIIVFLVVARLQDTFAFSAESFRTLGGIHEVHLRTGIINVDAEQQRLPKPTPSARRLLQQLSPAPTASSEWGPLIGAQLWLLTLGPELHVHPQQARESPLLLGLERPQEASAAVHGSPLPQFHDLQAELLKQLHQAGCAVVSFLPPAAWLLVVAEHADLAPLLEAFPDIRLAPFGRSEARISPELATALEVLERAGQLAVDRLAGGHRLDELWEQATAAQTDWLLGSMRLHVGGRHGAESSESASLQEQQSAAIASSEGQYVAARSDPAGRSQRPRVQIEVHFPHLEQVDLDVLRGAQTLSREYQYHPAAAAVEDWAAPLAALSPPDCPPLLEPDHGSPELLLVSVCPAAMRTTVDWLAAAPLVSWLAPRMASRLHNLVAGAIVQTGGNYASATSPQSVAAHPFWAAGINGTNQTVGCGDSGLDTGSCYFYDGAELIQKNVRTDRTNNMQYFSSTTHRKLRYYLAVVQDMTDGYGHGTHVAGTLVGSRYDRSDLNSVSSDVGTGQAPGAKIAFMDLSREKTDGVWTPGDLARSYFPNTYNLGARVHSDSWGSDLTAYDSMAAAVDRFSWYNQDFLSVFAAGNYGDKKGANTTVTSPAVAKNCIAAGATLTLKQYGAYKDLWSDMLNMTITLNLPGGQGYSRSVRVTRAKFGASFVSPPLGNIQIVAAAPVDACTSLSNAGAVKDKVVLVQRGSCYFTDKARSAMAAGARGVLVFNDRQEGGYFELQAPDSGSGNAIYVPVGGVPLSTGRWLLAAINAGTVTATFKLATKPSPYGAFEDIAPYSSFGPTTDGRIKPDIVAPGTLISALSKPYQLPEGQPPHCDTTELSGTSMATPVVAGSALLARQYFQDGYYPDGNRNPERGFNPSGALIKAVLLGGAGHMQGVIPDTGMPLEDAPSYRQGFGRLDLLHSLPLPSPSSPGWNLQVVDTVRSGAVLKQGEQHRYCVRSSGGPLRITLAWYDFAGEPAAAKALVNNLDLQVRAAGRGGLVEYGNGVQDNVNTVEQVWYDDLPPGDVAITVLAPEIFSRASPQPYALVVQGKFTGTLVAPIDATDSGSDTCAAQLVVIDPDMSTSTLTNRENVIFYFSLQGGGAPSSGYECRLSPADVNSSEPYTACSNPYTDTVADGRYIFQVRVRGEEVSAIRPLTVDTTPPVTTLTSSLTSVTTSSTNKLADVDERPQILTATDVAVFYFVASDVSTEIKFKCRFEFNSRAPNLTKLRFAANSLGGPNPESGYFPGGPVRISRDFSCSSPLEVVGMGFGDYQFQVVATDQAGNVELIAKGVNWKVRYQPGVTYARTISGAFGIVNSSSLAYSVVGFVGNNDPEQPPELRSPGGSQGYEWHLQPQTEVNASLSTAIEAAKEASWKPLLGPDLQVTVPVDGSYLVLVRPEGNANENTWAQASVHVDTTPPVVAIVRRPPEIQSDPRVTIAFGDGGVEGEIRAYYCRWVGPTPHEVDLRFLGDFDQPYGDCSGSVTQNVTEGFWVFQVKGRDVAGNTGYPSNVTFRTDLSAPEIVITKDPHPTNASRVQYEYSVNDTGTGVANVSCSLKWNYLVDKNNLVDGDDEYVPGSSSPVWITPCPNPAKYTVQEGLYQWAIISTDGAGLKASGTYPLTVDYTPPVSRVFSAPPRRVLPSRVPIMIGSVDKPDGSPSGIAQQLCKLDPTSAPPPASPPPSPPPPPLTPGTKAASVRSASSRDSDDTPSPAANYPQDAPVKGGSRRRLTSSNPRMGNGSPVQLGVWHVCDDVGNATNITYDGLSTGYYAFTFRAVDQAGNMGNPTAPYFFAVDETLPVDGSETIEVGGGGSSDKTKKIIIGVAILVGVIVIIGSIVGIIYARRRYLRKRYSGHPPPLQPANHANAIAMQPVSAPYANGNGAIHEPAAGVPSVLVVPTATSTTVAAVPYYPVVNGGVVAGTPAPMTDPALMTALAVSSSTAADMERARLASAAAVSAAEQERIRVAIAASIEEENLRKAMQASLAAAEQETMARQRATAEQAALDAAIAASLASAEADQRRQHSMARTQLQQQPSAPLPPPKDSLI